MADEKLFTAEKPAYPKEFDRLREMEAFSKEMFNRIVAFQEREHPAWVQANPFDQRIKNLPLHALIFSNPDRDPEKFGFTVAPFYPLRNEIRQIVSCVNQVSDKPLICDLHAGNGFVGSLFAREGVDVIGIRDDSAKPNQIEAFYDESCYSIKSCAIDQIDFEYDVALSCWMPGGKNLTPAILLKRPKLIVFIYTEHVNPNNNLPQTGTAEAYTDLPDNYKQVAEWEITRPQDIFHLLWPELTPSIEETRIVKVFADKPFHDIDTTLSLEDVKPYDWEYELDMTLIAHKARDFLIEQGMQL